MQNIRQKRFFFFLKVHLSVPEIFSVVSLLYNLFRHFRPPPLSGAIYFNLTTSLFREKIIVERSEFSIPPRERIWDIREIISFKYPTRSSTPHKYFIHDIGTKHNLNKCIYHWNVYKYKKKVVIVVEYIKTAKKSKIQEQKLGVSYRLCVNTFGFD